MPWRKLDRRKERLVVARLFFELGRVFHEAIYGDSKPFGASIDGIMVCCCVAIGHAEGRVMNATKISHYLDMPRTTVLRKLEELMDVGILERTGSYYHISPGRYADTIQYLERSEHIIAAASKALPDPVQSRVSSETDTARA
jgi:hypothetical protein